MAEGDWPHGIRHPSMSYCCILWRDREADHGMPQETTRGKLQKRRGHEYSKYNASLMYLVVMNLFNILTRHPYAFSAVACELPRTTVLRRCHSVYFFLLGLFAR